MQPAIMTNHKEMLSEREKEHCRKLTPGFATTFASLLIRNIPYYIFFILLRFKIWTACI